MKLNIKKIIFSFVFISTVFVACITGTKNIDASVGPGIAINPEYPKEQIKKDGIFNVMFKSNKNYNLAINIDNTTNNNKTIVVSPNTSYTSDSGNMLFDKSKVPSDPTRKYDFRSLFTQQERQVTIPGNTVNKVNFRLKMPPEQYQGIIAGGFYIKVLNGENNTSNSNFQIQNNFSYGLAAVIHNQDGTAQPKATLNNAKLNNNDNKLQTQSNIQNTGAGIISGMNVNSEIINLNNNNIVNKSNSTDLSMAPNSSFNYINTINNNLIPGQYKVKLSIKDNMGHHWKEDKDFKVSAQNYTSHFIKKIPWKLYTTISVIIILILLVIYLIYHQYKLKNKINDKKDNPKN